MNTPSPTSKQQGADSSQHPLRKITIEKITLNMGAGKNEEQLKRGVKLLEKIAAPQRAVTTVAKKRIPAWELRPGLAIGCKLTVRRNAEALLKRLLAAKNMKLSEKNFDGLGNFAFGIAEYIDIAEMEYDPELKIMGLEVAVTLQRPGFRVKHRKIKQTAVGKKQQITKPEAIAYVQNLGAQVEE